MIKSEFRVEDEDFSKDTEERKGFSCEDDLGNSEDLINISEI